MVTVVYLGKEPLWVHYDWLFVISRLDWTAGMAFNLKINYE